jgi:hypothetical protein
MQIKRCGVCVYYVPGGVERNCLKKKTNEKKATCPLMDACSQFKERNEKDVSGEMV